MIQRTRSDFPSKLICGGVSQFHKNNWPNQSFIQIYDGWTWTGSDSVEKVFNLHKYKYNDMDLCTRFIVFSSESATRQASGSWQNTPGSSEPAERRRRIHTTAQSRGIPVIVNKINLRFYIDSLLLCSCSCLSQSFLKCSDHSLHWELRKLRNS